MESAIHCRSEISNVILIEQALQGIVDSIDKESNAKKTPEGVQQGIDEAKGPDFIGIQKKVAQ